MRKTGLTFIAIVATLAIAAIAPAQRMIGAMPRHFLLFNPKVQTELKLSDAQKKAVTVAGGDAVSADEQGRIRVQLSQGTDMDAIKSALKKTITPAQDKRLTEVWIQRDGSFALSDDEVAKSLDLTADQKKKVSAVFDEFGEEMQELVMSNGGKVGPEESRALREKTKKKLDAILNTSQRAKFEGMKGKPFKWS
ncbi:MAG: hypothetical protein H7Y17_03530 [Chlorobia bacterium]|nr:hypothetical protein [Fimbriimonadaceae bacterium]